ncbi:hypothetical protein GYMLUDRAFT_37134 [Collybiopsis luxurians FD-317 M1]|nr:hypothetical protein GYMLUDRAFT_37134 [Collybiopsis luxurians FD-317 M1]
MAGLSDHIDRLAHNTRSIKSITASCANSGTGLFTRAVLGTQLGDLIRDIDSSELGLFTITAPSAAVARDKDMRNQAGVEITRAEFHGATPLRRPAGRRDELRPKEIQPEVFAEAALKVLDRYQEIRPMPRAYNQATVILEKFEKSNKRIQTMTEQLQQTQTAEAARSFKSVADEEQHRIDQIQDRIVALRNHREALLKQECRVEEEYIPKPSSSKIPEPVDTVEEEFWNTPGAKPLRFTENRLLDEEAEFADISIASSIPSPVSRFVKPRSVSPQSPAPAGSESSPIEETLFEAEEVLILDSSSATGEQGIESTTTEPDFPDPADTSIKGQKIRVNMEVERAVARIWSTAGELIMPGHSFNSTNNQPPVAKATISHLQSLSALTPTVASPTHSISTTSKSNISPTAQQILTAHLLLALLSSDTLSLPLNRVKELLATKASTSGSAAMVSGHPKALYGCVAKRLLKIERGTGGQVVKFDI